MKLKNIFIIIAFFGLYKHTQAATNRNSHRVHRGQKRQNLYAQTYPRYLKKEKQRKRRLSKATKKKIASMLDASIKFLGDALAFIGGFFLMYMVIKDLREKHKIKDKKQKLRKKLKQVKGEIINLNKEMDKINQGIRKYYDKNLLDRMKKKRYSLKTRKEDILYKLEYIDV